MDIKAPNKTTKTQFDLQMDIASKKHGVSFVLIHGNTIEYVNIPSVPEQRFKYFFNPSHLTAEERKRILQGQSLQKVESDPDDDI
jgi:hypothetical protein